MIGTLVLPTSALPTGVLVPLMPSRKSWRLTPMTPAAGFEHDLAVLAGLGEAGALDEQAVAQLAEQEALGGAGEVAVVKVLGVDVDAGVAQGDEGEVADGLADGDAFEELLVGGARRVGHAHRRASEERQRDQDQREAGGGRDGHGRLGQGGG